MDVDDSRAPDPLTKSDIMLLMPPPFIPEVALVFPVISKTFPTLVTTMSLKGQMLFTAVSPLILAPFESYLIIASVDTVQSGKSTFAASRLS